MLETKTELALRLLACVETKDFNAVMDFFTEDAVLVDPHYPKTRMQGHAEIADGVRWGFSSLKKFGFTIISTYTAADGKEVVIYVRTAHELPNGKPLNFPQLFLFEFDGQQIKSLEAFVQYEPHGVVGLMLSLARIKVTLISWKSRLTNCY